ncbi:MAG: hypothetical protein SF029_10835 [bacterium]|nr:hypothetical protein [bacterium]
MRRFLLICSVLLVGLVLPFGAVAQEALTELYISEELNLQFRYPADWEVDDSDGFPMLSNPNGAIALIFITPAIVNEASRGSVEPDKALQRVLEAVGATLESEAVRATVGNRDGARADISYDGAPGFGALVTFADGNFGVVIGLIASAQTLEDNQATLDGIIDSYDVADADVPEFTETSDENAQTDDIPDGAIGAARRSGNGASGSSEAGTGDNTSDRSETSQQQTTTDQLEDFDGDWEAAIAELQNLGLIEDGGRLIFEEDSAFFSGRGDFFTGLANRSPNIDVVMAAELSFTTSGSDDLETCSLLSRVVQNNSGNATRFLDVGISSSGILYYFNVIGDGDDDILTQDLVEDIDLDDPLHILFIAQGDRLTVFLNGELVAEDIEIQEIAGTYGVALRGRGAGARCEGSNIWAYQIGGEAQAVDCTVTATNTVNKRSGPGTNFDQAGQLRAGQSIEAVGQAEGTEGQTWYLLEDDTWVRSDVVRESGDCGALPEAEG